MDTVAVAGANGFIGSRLLRALEDEGLPSRPLLRRPPQGVAHDAPSSLRAASRFVAYEDSSQLRQALKGCRYLIHAAGRTNGSVAELEAANVTTTERLLEAAEAEGLERFVYLSSAAAVAGSGPYGRSKREAEARIEASPLRTVVLRPTMVYGPGDRGNLGFVSRVLRFFPLVPVLGGSAFSVQPLWIGDLCRCLIEALRREAPRSPYLIAGDELLPLKTLLRKLGGAMKLRRLYLPLPLRPARWAARFWQALFPASKLPLKQVLELHEHRPFDAREAREDLGLQCLPFDEGLRRLAESEGW